MTGASSMLFRRRAVSFRAVSMTVVRRWEILSVLSMGAMPRGEDIFELSMAVARRWGVISELSMGAMPRGEGIPEIFVCTTRRGAFIAEAPVFAAGCREVICAA